jgi:hypothetical protein
LDGSDSQSKQIGAVVRRIDWRDGRCPVRVSNSN